MQDQASAQEFEDLGSHRAMWESFTGFVFKSIVATVAGLLIVGWITGVL